MAACATKVSLYVLLRFDFFVFQQNLAGHAFQFAAILMPLAILGILVGSGVALFERNLKRLLAFSSVAQIGYIMLGASLLTVTGLTAASLHVFNHALAKGGLFLAVAGFATVAAGLRLEELGGLARRAPWTFVAFVICGLSLIGIPGTAGFVSKWYLITAALEFGAPGLALVARDPRQLADGGGAYIWRIVEAAAFAPVADNGASPGRIPLPLVVVTWFVAIANVYFGVAPAVPLELSASAADILLGHMR